MAYATGIVSTMSQFRDAIRAIALEAGWTALRNTGNELIMSNPEGDYWALRMAAGVSDRPTNGEYIEAGLGFYLYAPTGYTSGNTAFQQPGYGGSAAGHGNFWAVDNTGPYVRYYAFATQQYIHAVLEYRPGFYAHFQVGRLDKRGLTYGGGQYLQSHYPDFRAPADGSGLTGFRSDGRPWATPTGGSEPAALRPNFTSIAQRGVLFVNDFEGRDGRWAYMSAGTQVYANAPAGYFSFGSGLLGDHPDMSLLQASCNEMTGDMLLVPPRIYLRGAQNRLYPMGEVPDIAYCDMRGVEPASIKTLGAEEWMVFPLSNYNPNNRSVASSSWTQGVAYKVVL